MITFKATISSAVDDAEYSWIFQAENLDAAFDEAQDHFKDSYCLDLGTLNVEEIYSGKVLKLPALDDDPKVQYCIKRFVDMVNEAAQEYSIIGIYQAIGYLSGLSDSGLIRVETVSMYNRQICNLYLNDRGWITEAGKRGF